MNRSLNFEALEQRVAMSQGLIHPIPAVPARGLDRIKIDQAEHAHSGTSEHRAGPLTDLAHSVIVAARQAKLPIKGNFRGGQSSLIPGTNYVAMGGSSGKIGKVSFQATMYGQVSGKTFEGGTLHLFNSSGTILTDLGPGKLVVKGKTEDLKVGFEFDQGTGPYAQVAGSAGTLTIELTRTKSKAQAETAPGLDADYSANWKLLTMILSSGNPEILWRAFVNELP